MADLYTVVAPLLRLLPPETAHGITLKALKFGWTPASGADDPLSLRQRLFGLDIANPVGLAAGFDKNAEVPDAMLSLGFGFVEVGTVTPRPQPGNVRPRVFRLTHDRAVINRLGFNNDGFEVVRHRLAERSAKQGVLGVNIGANRDSRDRIADYADGVRNFASLADYLTVNISSPNTPGLRDMQDPSILRELIEAVHAARAEIGAAETPILFKIAPDLADSDLTTIAETMLVYDVYGFVVSNTTVGERACLHGRHADERGGLSGRPLFDLSTNVLRQFYAMTEGRLPLIGVGGISSGQDAYAKIRAGASLVQLYTALIFEGPGLVGRIKADLAACLTRDGFAHVSDAIGADIRLAGKGADQ